MKLAAPLLAGALMFIGGIACAQVIIADDYNVSASGSGFALGSGVNSAINPPATRLSGSAAANLRYILTTTTKAETAFTIATNKLRVTAAANPGRFSLSANGTTAFDFGPALGSSLATPQKPVVYDVAIKMANASAGTQRFSFALGSAEGDATTWDFGLQLYRSTSSDSFYTIGKRIDTTASGLSGDLNAFIANTPAGTFGKELSFLLRVTDAGAETSAFHSRVQLSLDGGSSWLYDTASDPALPNGWRLDGPGRYILWDVAPDAGNVTFDSFLVRLMPLSASLIAPRTTATNLGASPLLTVAVSNAAPGNLSVGFFGRESASLNPGRDFALVVLPDTQNYAREASGNGAATKEMWFAQTEWIVTNRVVGNIAYVAHLGDVVQNGDIKNGSANLTEWRNATNAMYRLENPIRTLLAEGIPYGVAVGNHDQEPIGEEDGASKYYNQYFGVSHFAGRSYYGGHFSTNNDSHFDLFSASGLEFIVLYFEFGRYGSGVLDWANAVLATNQQRRAIVVTHYAGSDSTPSNLSPQGDAIYNALKGNTNFFLMLGGHVFENAGEGSRSSTYQGRTVRTFISDFQGYNNGGNGYMRLMYFSPSNNVVSIKTFSPWLNLYQTDADSQMSFSYDMQASSGSTAAPAPFSVLGTNLAVAPGSLSSRPFAGLEANTAYEWYVQVNDSLGNLFKSPTWGFTTAANAAPVVTNRVVSVMAEQPTLLNLQASDSNGDYLTVWSSSPPLHGLLSDWDPVGGTFSYLPARGFRGLDRFSFQASDGMLSSPVGTMVLNVLAPADSNTNGLPDAWEAAYGLSSPEADADGDGQSNRAEYLAGTNPTNAASVFRILSAGWEPEGDFTLSWSSVGGARYRVQVCESNTQGGLSGSFSDLVRDVALEMDPSPYGTASTQSFSLTPAESGSSNSALFYRVQLVP